MAIHETNGSYIVRDATIDDMKDIVNIYASYVRDTAITFEERVPSLEEYTERYKRIIKKYPYLVMVSGGHIVGYAYINQFSYRSAYDPTAESTIYLDQTCKGRGYGRILYTHLETLAEKQGIATIVALIGASSDTSDPYVTDASIHFHNRLGYTSVGRLDACAYKFARWYDLVWMAKRITSKEISKIHRKKEQ